MRRKNIKNDRRWLRTHRNIKKSFLSLLMTKSIEEITIKEIAIDADVNRNTFYLHFEDVYDLMEELEEEILSSLENAIRKIELEMIVENKYYLTDYFVDLLENYLDLYLPFLVNVSHQELLVKAKSIIKMELISLLSDYKIINRESLLIFVEFFASGIISVFNEWLANDERIELKELSNMLMLMITSNINAILNREYT